MPVVVGLDRHLDGLPALNPIFLSRNNLVNLLFDCSTVGVISLGIVCVLMVGEIDLSVGSISGFASALVGVLWVNSGWPVAGAILAARLPPARLIGSIYAFLFNRFGHAELRLHAGRPARRPRPAALHPRVRPARSTCPTAPLWYQFRADAGDARLALLSRWSRSPAPRFCSPGCATSCAGGRRRAYRRRHRCCPCCRRLAITALLELVVFYLNQSRGVPWMFGFFVGLVVVMNYALTRTKWGRSMTAVGGNREAARRAGINVRRIYTTAFVLCSTLAAVGGVLSAARLATSSQQAGTGDVNLNAIAAAVIGGTSLFGGRGSAYSALLGIIVIQSIASGLTLLDLSSSLRYMITGGVLAIAVIVDSLARRSRASPRPRLRQRIPDMAKRTERKGRRHHRRGIRHRPRMCTRNARGRRQRGAGRPRRGPPGTNSAPSLDRRPIPLSST